MWISAADQPDAELVYFHENVSIDERGTMSFATEVDILIHNRKGEYLTEIRIPYRQGNRIKNLQAELYDAQGQLIKKLKKSDIKDRHSVANFALYEDDLVKEFQLLHPIYPYHLKYSYTIDYDEYLAINRWVPYIDFDIPTREAKFTLTKPEDFKIHIYSTPDVTHSQSGNTYVWEMKNCPPISKESMGPGVYEQSPKVIVLPNSFKYGVPGNFSSWQDYGDWREDLNKSCLDFSPEQKATIRQSVAHLSDDREKIRLLYHQLQDEMRYIYVGIEYGGLQSYPASYVASNKFGDCKALTTYMQASLDAIGISSYPVAVYADDEPIQIIEDFPVPQFNHIFLCVPMGEDSIWLENTSKTAVFGYPNTFTQNRKALFIKRSASQIVDIPSINIDSSLCTRNMKLSIKNDHYEATFRGNYRGASFELYKSLEEEVSKDRADSYLKRYFPIRKAEIKEWEIKPKGRDIPEIVLEASAITTGGVKKYGANRMLFLPAYSSLYDLEKPESRKTELRIRIPINLCDSIHYRIDSSQFSSVTIPDAQHQDADVGHYSLEYQPTDEGVLCIRRLRIYPATYAPGDEYEAFYDFQSQIKKIERSTTIALKP